MRQQAVEAMTAAIGSSCDVSGAAHLPAAVAALLPPSEVAGAGGAVTALRLEGFAPSVAPSRADVARHWCSRSARSQPLRRVLRRRCGRRFAMSRRWRRTRPGRTGRCGGSRRRRPGARKLPPWSAAETDAQTLFDWAGGLVVAGAGAVRRCRRGRDSPCRCGGRRARDAHPGAGCGARGHRGVRPAGCRACCVEQAGQGELRSEGRAQSGTNVGGGLINGSIRGSRALMTPLV